MTVLPRASPSHAENSWLAIFGQVSWLSLADERQTDRTSFTAGSLPDSGSVALVAGSFENITVAGPRGHLTRFPILPDLGAPEAFSITLKEQF